MKTPADTGGGGGSTCGGDLLPRETRRRNFGGAEGFRRSPSDPQLRGTPKYSRPVASHSANGGYCMGPPISGCGLSGVGAASPGPLSARTPRARLFPTPGITEVAESFVAVLSRCTLGAGTCAGLGGGAYPRGPLSSVLCCEVRPVTFTAARALHRLREGYGMASRRRA